MFFILSKTLYYITMPIVWITFILLFALITKNQKRRKRSLLIAFVLLLFFSNGFIINEFFTLWEKDAISIAQTKNYEWGIVLTGVTNTEKSSEGRVWFDKGADRVLHTVQLYKLGKIKKILITGGSGHLVSKKDAEANQLKEVFLYCGIPNADIVLENKSRNTHENALFTKQKIDSIGIKEKSLLITSAFHMRRSLGCFEKEGVNVDEFPVDYYTHDRKYSPDALIIPSEKAMYKWSILIHEVLGYVMYKLVGYC
jgi:uncharacterized SAM-binding protein YcdF (DUF218 family)